MDDSEELDDDDIVIDSVVKVDGGVQNPVAEYVSTIDRFKRKKEVNQKQASCKFAFTSDVSGQRGSKKENFHTSRLAAISESRNL